MAEHTLFTIGHSNHTVDSFMRLLRLHYITLVLDVRSQPYSSRNRQFNREDLRTTLNKNGIGYLFLGQELGARSKNMTHYVNGKVQYKAIASSAEFSMGLEHIRERLEADRVVLLCAEKDPLNCHRAILICKQLRGDAINIQHILENGHLQSTADLETRMLRQLNLPDHDLFTSRSEMIERAYEIQGEKIAYSLESGDS